jgi:molybdopterin-guanine dinucleotide biosynthesis protein
MRQRAFVHVAGPAGAGKTAFIEAVLQGLDETVICVRAARDDKLRSPKESAPKGSEELRRYRAVGASAVAAYRFSAGKTASDAFFMSEVMQDYSTAVFIEGDCPVEFADLSVFVAPPLEHGQSLLRRVQRDEAAARAASLKAFEVALDSPEALMQLLTGGLGEPLLAEAFKDPRVVEKTRSGMADELRKLRALRSPKPTLHWALAPGCEGIERAQLIVVNTRDDVGRARADHLLEEVGRLRKDPAVYKDILGWRSSKVPITAVAASVADPKDPGLKKAIARVRRAVRSAR